MVDPRKPVLRPEPEHEKAILHAVHQRLLAATDAGAREIGATGCAFVIIGVGVWAQELAELDGRATAKFLRAIADIYDPASNENRRRRADKDRSQAVRALYAALDLEMAEAAGNG